MTTSHEAPTLEECITEFKLGRGYNDKAVCSVILASLERLRAIENALAELVRAAEDALLALNMGLGQTEAQYEDAVKQAIKARDAITQALAKLDKEQK